MEQNLHLLLYRTFHAQRKYLRAYMKELGLGVGQPKLIAYLSDHGPCRQRELAETLPYDHIDIGVTKGYLVRELHRAEAAETTPYCQGNCQGCGLMKECGVTA